jgi:hypothetical protein
MGLGMPRLHDQPISPRRRYTLPFIAGSLYIFACESPPQPPPVSPANVPTTALTTGTTGTPSTTAHAATAPKLEVRGNSGALDPAAAARLEPARGVLEQCRPGNGGKLDIRLSRQDHGTLLHVEPGPSLDPRTGHCALEALSTIDLEPTAGNVGGPTTPPTGFTSLITISW